MDLLSYYLTISDLGLPERSVNNVCSDALVPESGFVTLGIGRLEPFLPQCLPEFLVI